MALGSALACESNANSHSKYRMKKLSSKVSSKERGLRFRV